MPTKSIADRPRYWLLDLSLGLFCLLNLRHRELTIDPVRHEANAITGLHCFQHRRIGRAERHSHPRVHLKLLDWAVLDYDFASGLVDPGDFPAHVFVRLRHYSGQVSAEPEQQWRKGDVPSWSHCDLVCACAVSLFHNDLAMHAGFVVSRNEAGELELPSLGEPPEQLAALGHGQTLCVRVIMLHLGKLLHQLRVFAV